jgi:LuxR family transcriptional regulator, maltose regulon positive regulatory protein
VTPDADSIDESKLHPQVPRIEWIQRPRLLARLSKAVQQPITLVAAPAGYGKSTLVAQWFDDPEAPGLKCWVGLDPGDNDPTRLWAHVATALERIGCWGEPSAADYVASMSTAISTRVVPRVVDAVSTSSDPVTIVLDDCHLLRSAECSEQLDRLVEHLPPNAHLILIARADPALRLGRLRVDGRLSEIRSKDLAFTTSETRALLEAADIELADSSLEELERRTEGWPAAVYLGALTLHGRPDPDEFVDELVGNNRFIADYLSEEVLNRQDPELRAFVQDMSVFERFNASLGDHVSGAPGSARLIRVLERTNLFLIPLDGPGAWFRFHHLFGAFARSALESEDPDRLRRLQRQGSEWFGTHGHVDEAIQHALSGELTDQAASQVQANWLRYFDAGRSVTVLGWLRDLKRTAADTGAAVTVTAAWMAALHGQRDELEHRLAVLDTVSETGPLPDGTKSAQSALALIRGLFGYDGPTRMLSDARCAAELEDDRTTPWYATAQAALGHARYVVGELQPAAVNLTNAANAPHAPAAIRVLALGTLSLCEAEADRINAAEVYAEAAMNLVERHAMQAAPQGVFAFTALGAARAASGQLDEALALFDEGLQVRTQLPGLSPWPLIHHLMAMSRANALANQPDRAESLLTQARGLCAWREDTMSVMRMRLAKAQYVVVSRDPAAPMLGAALTRRELQVLRRLQGPQTLREIAAELYVSRNTIKTLTTGLYRKLGAHSRTEALVIARERSLL